MTPEDYVSYPIALALKMHGFDLEVNHVYDKNGELWEEGMNENADCNCTAYFDYNKSGYIEVSASAPTLAQAQKWLRDKKGIAINVIAHGCHEKYREGKYHWEEIHLPNSNEKGPQWVDWFIYGKHPLFDTYEEALSDGLSQMLELIEKDGE